MAIVRVSGTVNTTPNGNSSLLAPNGAVNILAGNTATITAGGPLNATGAGTVSIGAVSTSQPIVTLISTGTIGASSNLYIAYTNGISPFLGYTVSGTNIVLGTTVTSVTPNFSVGIYPPSEGGISTGTQIVFYPPPERSLTYVIISATNVIVQDEKSVTYIQGQIVVGPHITLDNNTTTQVNQLLINSTSTANVGNPAGIEYTGTNIFDTSSNRTIGAVYVPGGVGIEKDLNVGGTIYGRVYQATSSTAIVVSATNTNTNFYPVFVDDIRGITSAQLYGNSSTYVHPSQGLTYNPYSGLLSVERIFVGSTASSTSTTTGGLVVKGGVGVGENINVGGNIIPHGSTTTDIGAVPTSTIGDQENRFSQGFVDNLYSSLIQSINTQSSGGDYSAQNISMLPQAGGYVDIFGDIRVRGRKPIGTAPVVTNVLWVTVDGDDTNDGASDDPSRACRTVTGATKSPLYQAGTQIRVHAGHYLEDNPVELKPYTSVVGSDLRTTSVEPINKTQDLFHVQSGCYIAQMQMTNGRSGLLDGPYLPEYNRGAYCTAFPPLTGSDRIDLFHSPYIQNCTNQSGPWMKDGTMFQPSGTVQVPRVVATSTWEAGQTVIQIWPESTATAITPGLYINSGQQSPGFWNARTLLLANKPFMQEQVVAFVDQAFSSGFEYDREKCRRDAGFVLTGAAYDIALNTNYNAVTCGNAYRRGNASSYAVTATELTQTLGAFNYLKGVVQSYIGSDPSLQSRNNRTFNELNAIITSGTTYALIFTNPVGVDPNVAAAKTQLVNNRTFIQAEVVTWIQNQIANNISPFAGFVYNSSTCYRDVGYIVDALCYDVLYGGNSASVDAAYAYFVGNQSQIEGETSQTVASYQRLLDVAQQIVQGQTVSRSPGNTRVQSKVAPYGTSAEATTLVGLVGIVTDAITAGSTSTIPSKTYPDYTGQSTAEVTLADDVLNNETTVIDSMINWINTTFSGFQYDQAKCSRDTGLILDAVVQDMLFGGTSQSTFAGLQYWNQGKLTGEITREIATTTAAVNYLKDIATKIALSDTSGTRYQTSVAQVTGSAGSSAETVILNQRFNTIIDVLQNGTSGVTDDIVPNNITAWTTASTVNAYNLLQANKDYMKAEVIAYVESVSNNFSYNKVKCRRDTGLIVDAIAQDVMFDTVSQSSFAGLQYWNQDGYTGLISTELTTTTNAINWLKNIAQKIILNDTSGTRYAAGQITGDAGSTAEVTSVGDNLTLITTILTNGTSGVTDYIVPNGLVPTSTTSTANAYLLLQSNKNYIQDEVIGYIEATKTSGFLYNQTTCRRDVEYILDSICFDLIYGGNRQSIQSAVYYYNFDGASSSIPNEIPQTTAAYEYIATILPSIISGSLITPYQRTVKQVTNLATGNQTQINNALEKINLITDIVQGGPTTSGIEKTPIPLLTSTQDAIDTAKIIKANRQFIQAEVIAYIDATYPPVFSYDKDTCRRDVGYIIDSVSFDLLYSGNRQSIQSAVYYYEYSMTASAIAQEIPQTTDAYKRIQSLLPYIVKGQAVPTTYQNVVTQVTGLTTATDTQASIATSKIDHMLNIIIEGPEVAPAKTPIPLTITSDADIINAATLIDANKEFIKAETIAYINDKYGKYDQGKCYRDVGLIVDSLATDLLYQSSSESKFAGLQYWNQQNYVGEIPNEITTTTAAISYVKTLAADIATTVGGATVGDTVAADFDVILNILSTGVSGITDVIVSNGTPSTSTDVISAYNALIAAIPDIQDQTIAYVNDTIGFTNYTTATCARDIKYMVESVAFDLLNPDPVAGYSNKQAIKSGVYYYAYNESVTRVDQQVPQTTAAYNFIKGIIPNIITATPLPSTYQNTATQVTNLTPGTIHEIEFVKDNIDVITNILRNGPSVAGDKVPMNLTTSTNQMIWNAYELLVANRQFIQAETIAYVNNQLNYFEYSREFCFRDVGIIVENIAYDAVFGGNEKSVQSGLAYYDGVISRISGQETQTVSALDYLEQLCLNVIANSTVTSIIANPTYHQVINTDLIGTHVVVPSIKNNIGIITNIILNGPEAAPQMYVGTGPDAAYMSAEILMEANRQFIQQQTINYINWNLSRRTFPYSKKKCSRDVGLIIDSIALDVLYPTDGFSQSNFAGLQYWKQSSLTGTITQEFNQTVDAISYLRDLSVKVIQNITPSVDLVPRYSVGEQVLNSNPGTSVEVLILDREFNQIIDILKGNIEGITDKIESNGLPYNDGLTSKLAAAQLLQDNKEYMKIEVNAYIQATNPGFTYDEVTCARDIGYIIDSVTYDLVSGGNRQAIQAGLSYYTEVGGDSVIPTEIPQTIAAYNYISILAQKVVQNLPPDNLYQNKVRQLFGNTAATSAEANVISTAISTITNIINNGPSVAYDQIPLDINQTPSTDQTVAFELLMANKDFIKAEVIAYLEYTYNPDAFTYNEDLCYRDTGLIVDAVSQDILLGGNSKSIEAGLAYWNKGYNHVAGQETTTTMALNYARDIALQIVANQPVTVITGTTTKQVINPYFQYGGDYMPQQNISRCFNIITTIIENGPLYAPPVYQGSGLFSATGQLANDVKIAASVTYVEEVGDGSLLIGLSTATVGFAKNATLYFGDISVYPLSDIQVEARSLEYTGNTSTWNSRKLDPIGSMGGSLVDGAVISDRSPINSFVYDAFTQVNQGGHGIKITNNGYAQLVSVFSVFCSIGVQVTNGGIASIVNSNANFGDICLLAKGFGKRAFSGTLYNPAFKAYPDSPGPDGLNQYYPNGFWPNGGSVEVFTPDVKDRPHISLVMEVEPDPGHTNEQNLPGFLNAQPSLATLATGTITITGIDTTNISVGNSVYIRDQYGFYTGTNYIPYADTGTIVADVGYQSVTLNKALTNGGGDSNNANFFTLFFCGNAYYTVLSSTVADNPRINGTNILSAANTATDQVQAHIAALRYLNTLTNAIVSNAPLTGLYQNTFTQTILPLVSGGANTIPFIDLRFNDTIRILGEPTNSTEAEALYPESLRTKTGTVPSGAGSAITLIEANLDFLSAEVSAYVTATNKGFVYNTATCIRDSGYIIDGASYDIALGTNYNAVTCGTAYRRGASATVLAEEKIQTIAAINYISTESQAFIESDSTALSRGIEAYNTVVSVISTGTRPTVYFTNPTSATAEAIACKDQLIANKEFLQTEVTSWILDQLQSQTAPFDTFYYDQDLCRRDSGFILTGVKYDIALGTNYNAVTCGNAYQRGSSASVLANELTQTLGAINFMKTEAASVISSSQSAVDRSNQAFNEITSILSSSPPSALVFPDPTNASQTKIAAKDKLIANKAFIQSEVTAWINDQIAQNIGSFSGFSYDEVTCYRDVGYIVDALCYDLLYGGNSASLDCARAYFVGTTSQISGETTQTATALQYMSAVAQSVIRGIPVTPTSGNTQTQVTSGNNATITEANTLNTLVLITVNAINAGNLNSLPATTYPSISWASAGLQSAASRLESNKTTIINSVIAYINETYVTFPYDNDICYRDVGFIVDALCYDLLYGGNSAMVTAAQAYFTGTSGDISAIPNESTQTVAAFTYLSGIAQQVIQGQSVTPTTGNTVVQQTAGNVATGTEASQLNSLITIVTDTITAGNDNGTPAVVNPDYSWASSTIKSAVQSLQLAKPSIISNTIDFINSTFSQGFDYDDKKCRRDILLILRRLIYDIESGGRYNSVMTGLSYWARNGTHHIVQLGENVRRTDLFPDGATVNFYQRSYISASGYVFEYVGAGTNYGALPQVGFADPIQSKETVQLDSGKVFFTSTDQNGDFRIGPGLVISQATGVLSGRTFTKSLFANMTPFILAIEG